MPATTLASGIRRFNNWRSAADNKPANSKKAIAGRTTRKFMVSEPFPGLNSITGAKVSKRSISGLDRRRGNRHLFHNFDAEPLERYDLARVVGEQPDGVQPQIRKDLRADAAFVLELLLPRGTRVMHEIAAVRDHAGRAQFILLDTEARTGLVQVNQHTHA